MIDRNDEPRDDESRGSFVGKNRACSVGEFFKGWRRKAGLVTLAMACVLAVAWMRSYVIEDRIVLSTTPGASGQHAPGAANMIASRQGKLWLYHWMAAGLEEFAVPYWSLVLPLTLLSAWLILAKPRKAKAATGSTP